MDVPHCRPLPGGNSFAMALVVRHRECLLLDAEISGAKTKTPPEFIRGRLFASEIGSTDLRMKIDRQLSMPASRRSMAHGIASRSCGAAGVLGLMTKGDFMVEVLGANRS